jgi:RNA polymerase sigma factor (sigma-70 family)
MAGAPSGLLRHVQRLAAGEGMDPLTDRQLLQRFAASGDQSAFGLLLRRHGPMVLGVCRRLLGHEQDAEDAFQAAFLILARKAGAIRQPDLGGYLYRVAYHLATRARAGTARRKERERRAEAVATSCPADDATWSEVRAVVDEELRQLPGEPRSAVVLCYLEGRTQEEAARQLGWSKGTLRRRLDKGRELLRKRLLARGLAPVAALTATLFAEGAAPPVPALLTATTLRLAASAGAIAPPVAALVEAGLKVSSAGRTKLAVTAVLALSALMGVGLWACRVLADTPVKPAPPPTPAGRKAGDDVLAVRGRVLGPDGMPVAGARLYSPRWLKAPPEGREEPSVVERGKTDADGRFQFELPRADGRADRPLSLLAVAEGFGLYWVDVPLKEAPGDVTLRLVKDVPVRGRLVSTEGKPVPGVTVTVTGLVALDKLDDFLRLIERGVDHVDESTVTRQLNLPLNGVLGVKPTDKDGVFELRGVGAERLALLELKDPAIAPGTIVVVARPGFDAKNLFKAPVRSDGVRLPRFVGPSFDHVVLRPSGSAVEGQVREAGSGKPVAGAVVRAGSYSAVADAGGHYRVEGFAPERREYPLFVTPPKGVPLIASWKRISPEADRKTLRADVELTRGVVVTGRVYDKSTGKGVGACSIHYTPLPENKTPTKDLALYTEVDADGRFRLVTIPGPGVLLAQVPGTLLKIEGVPIYPYKAAEFAAADRPRITSDACKVVDVKDDGKPFSCDLALDPGKTLAVNLEDPEGKPLAGTVVAGVSERILRTVPFKTAAGRIYALDPDKPRPVAFVHAGRKLAALVTLRGDEKEPLVIRLSPAAVVTGRALDEDGQPLAGAEVYPLYATALGEQFNKSRGGDIPEQTDKEGRFRLEGIVPGLSLGLGFRKGRRMLVPEKRLEVKAAESGQALDAGDFRTKPRDP